jgi:hypothetical protein
MNTLNHSYTINNLSVQAAVAEIVIMTNTLQN